MSSTSSLLAVGPRIPGSYYYNSNYTYNQQTDKMFAGTLTNSFITIANGIISGLTEPTASSQLANKAYVDAALKLVSDPNYSIQYNAGSSVFGGSSNLTFNPTNNVLTSTNSIIGNSTTTVQITGGNVIYSGSISGYTVGSLVITKGLVDSLSNLTVSTITDLTSTTYSALQMVNGYIERTINADVNDYTDIAQNIIAQIPTASTNGYYRFDVHNASTAGTLTLTANTGINIYPTMSSLSIYPDYKVTSQLVATGPTSINMLVDFYGPNDPINFIYGYRSLFVSSDVTRVSSSFQYNTTPETISVQNYTYQPSDVVNIISRDFTGAKTDTFGDIGTFIQSFYTLNNPIYNIYKSGAIELVIRNISTSGSLTLVQDANAKWTMDPNSNMTIPAGKVGYFYLYIDVSNELGYIYVIGIN